MANPNMHFDDNQEVLPPSGPVGRDLEVRIFGSVVTAQRVAVARNEKGIIQALREKAAVNGELYYYEWEATNRDGSKGVISGISIKGANLVARLFGNCNIDMRAMPYNDTHEIHYARFVDLETGFSMTRSVKQRIATKAMGRMDLDRTQDLTFQIGQSKAARNVINNALGELCQELLEAARRSLVDFIEQTPENSKKVVTKIWALADKHKVVEKQMETYIGRPMSEWLTRHIAKMYVTLNSIDNGDATVNDVFGTGAPTMQAVEDGPADDKKAAAGKEADGNQQSAQAGAATASAKKRAPRGAAKADVDDKAAGSADGQGGVVGKVGEASAGQAGNAPQEQTAEGPKPGGAGAPAGKSEPAQSESKAAAPAASQKELSPSNRQEPVADKAAGSAPNPTEAAEEDWGWGQEQ
jgi:hypothetical protein